MAYKYSKRIKNIRAGTDITGRPFHVSEFRRTWKVFVGRKVVALGFIITIIFILTAIFAPFLAPHNPDDINLTQRLLQPSSQHLLGTDSMGRDTLSRIIYGTRISLAVGAVAVGIAAAIGMLLGMIAGYSGGWAFIVIMRFIDSLMAFPLIIKAIIIAVVLGGGIFNVMVAVGIGLMAPYARLMCGQVLQIREKDYVSAARTMGASNNRIMLHHILPNTLSPLIVLITMQFGFAILTEASLSFLGIGIEPGTATWGSMVSDGYRFLITNPVLAFSPGLALMLMVFGFNMIGDGLRDALDPRLRGTL